MSGGHPAVVWSTTVLSSAFITPWGPPLHGFLSADRCLSPTLCFDPSKAWGTGIASEGPRRNNRRTMVLLWISRKFSRGGESESEGTLVRIRGGSTVWIYPFTNSFFRLRGDILRHQIIFCWIKK